MSLAGLRTLEAGVIKQAPSGLFGVEGQEVVVERETVVGIAFTSFQHIADAGGTSRKCKGFEPSFE